MMELLRRFVVLCAAGLLLAAAPAHIQTADYWAGYAGTKVVPAVDAARWLSWVETDVPGAKQIAPLGVKTILYSDPHRVLPNSPLYGQDEDEYAHTCSGTRVRASSRYAGQVLTNPKSATLAATWRGFVSSRTRAAHFDAVFADDSVGALYAPDQPCGFDFDDWIGGANALHKSLGFPVIYNGLNDFDGRGIAREIGLNDGAIGGMMEDCYRRAGGWKWSATEATEIRMAREHKYFFCYVHDLLPADQAYTERMFAYASLLLTYDPNTTVLWEYYKTPTAAHVMPESQLVAWDPVVRNVSSIAALKRNEGVYVREFQRCFIAGREVGACAAAVNPDASAHPLQLSGYRGVLMLNGSGVYDGGSISVGNQSPPAMLPPLSAVIAFK